MGEGNMEKMEKMGKIGKTGIHEENWEHRVPPTA